MFLLSRDGTFDRAPSHPQKSTFLRIIRIDEWGNSMHRGISRSPWGLYGIPRDPPTVVALTGSINCVLSLKLGVDLNLLMSCCNQSVSPGVLHANVIQRLANYRKGVVFS